MLDFKTSNSKSEVLKSNFKENYFFLKNYITSEGAVYHYVLYYQPLPITRPQDNYFESLPIVSTAFKDKVKYQYFVFIFLCGITSAPNLLRSKIASSQWRPSGINPIAYSDCQNNN